MLKVLLVQPRVALVPVVEELLEHHGLSALGKDLHLQVRWGKSNQVGTDTPAHFE